MLTKNAYTHIHNLTKSFNLHKFTHSSSLSTKSIIFQNSKITENARNGNIKQAEHIFHQMPIKNVVSWTAMVSAYVENGDIGNARKVFDEMPDRNVASWNAMITGYMREKCGVDKGFELFGLMPERNVYKIEPSPDHYACMVDLLGRASCLDEAYDFVNSMPFEPHFGVWGALLSASRTHCRLDLAEIAARHISELEPDNATPYVVLSDIYLFSKKKDDEELVRTMKRLKGIKKSPGCSL